MCSQARNNWKVFQPIPAVPITIYVIARNLIAITTTDINLSTEQVCSTERARRVSRNSGNAPRGKTPRLTSILQIYTTGSNNNTQGSSMKQKKNGKAQTFHITRRLFLWKAHLKDWSVTTITPISTRLPARSWCCQSGRKTWVLY